MSAAKIKGSLLEFAVRRLLHNCGFTSVVPDGLMIYKRAGLTMINGKGAAHDADVLVNPPIQMPFSYPHRLNFECKAYAKKAGLPIIRNALGLRYDINEFELITKQNLLDRQNNRRSQLAIYNRQRFNYQIGVATIDGFTKPAFEFAANNKIPLLSLRWFLPSLICDNFHHITDQYLAGISDTDKNSLMTYLKGGSKYGGYLLSEESDSIFRTIVNAILEVENKVMVGLLESGDMLFMFSENELDNSDILENTRREARFHYEYRQHDYWILALGSEVRYGFYLPKNIVGIWQDQNRAPEAALDIKRQYFSKLIIFTKDTESPYRIIPIDRRWIDEVRNEL